MLNPVRKVLHTALIAALAIGGLTAADSLQAPAAQAVGEDTFTNPLAPDTADPTIEFHDGNYYMVSTTWDNKVVMRKAPTLAALGTTKPVTVYSDTNAGRNGNMWAPELKRLNGPNGWRWYLMYTMGVAGDYGTQHLQVIESAADDPMGPYTYKGRPLPIDDWNIDGSYLELNGELFMVWSEFAPDGLQSNYIARMSNPWTATGPLNILSQPVESWETIGQPVNEGPIALQHDGRTWVTYSASFCGTADYQLGTLEYTGGDPVLSASWQKSDGPVFSQANGVYGSGHNDFFTSPDGTQTWNLYHANARPDGGCSRERSARAQIVTWDAAGEPDFGIPQATSTAISVPSGENAPLTAHVEGARWNLVSRSTGQCATVSTDEDGAAMVAGDCSSARSRFVLDTTGDGYLRIVNAVSGKALGPSSCTTAAGAALEQTPWRTKGCQQWSVAQTTGGWSTLTNRTSGKLLAAGTSLTQSAADGSAAQDWALRPAGAVVVTSMVSGKALEVPGCSTADGAILQQREYTATACQSVTFTAAANGESEMHLGAAPDKCLAVSGGSSADSVAVTQGACGIAGSSWRLLVSGEGVVEFRNGTSGKALDLSFCAAADGTRVHQYSVLNNDCQRFRFSSVAVDPAAAPEIAAFATSRCVAGKAVVVASVRNADAATVAVSTTAGSYGSKSLTVAAGDSVSASFNARTSALAAGSVQLTVPGATFSAGYPAKTC
ncbi:GH43 family beta-xylosidase [Microbacterium natoriense]|uniref:GH43 family beta-xylosidase n=1 Tax=Microbacterium natoriense TaxID=284570 RepID=A0AAW8F1L4_9MICO|nr:family 43 glycosylhydrolase [Microbacterium natoriense]MDQ0649678.1 GH43 family beta-xylosidase [Microbacterium natoriense]